MGETELFIIGLQAVSLALLIWYTINKKDSEGGLELRKEIREMDADRTRSLMNTLDALGKAQQVHLLGVSENIKNLKDGNEKKLEEMRLVVDEKLQSTLEKRISESFRLVSERLEAVQRGLGEMQALANDTANLKKVLANVSTRGAMGEIQAEQIL